MGSKLLAIFVFLLAGAGLSRVDAGGQEIAGMTLAELEGLALESNPTLVQAAMRVRAAPIAIGGVVSFFFARWKRTGLMRATT